MKLPIIALVAVLALGGVVVAQSSSQSSMARLQPELTQQAQRACVFPLGGWTIIDCSAAAAAQSAQLNTWSRYVVQCGSDSYIATGDQSTDEADSNDGWLPSGSWLEFMTTDQIRYFSCRNKAVDTDCRLWECQ